MAGVEWSGVEWNRGETWSYFIPGIEHGPT